MIMHDKISEAIKYMEHVMIHQGRDWFSPTEIGQRVGGGDKHSSYGSPICKKMVSLGIAERSDKGRYKLLAGYEALV